MISQKRLLELATYLRACGVAIVTTRSGDDIHVEIDGCDGTPRHALAWADGVLGGHGRLEAFLAAAGAPCDCSILERAIDGRAVEGA
jgi:hypothetical protein